MIGAKKEMGIKIIKRREGADRSEMLLQITANGARRFVIYISDKEMDAMSLFDASFDSACELFDMIAQGNLSAIHLEEVISDFSKEKIL